MNFTVSEGNLPTWGAVCGVNPADIDRDIFEHGRAVVDKKYVVPEGMMKAAYEQHFPAHETWVNEVLKFVCWWLSENPILPEPKTFFAEAWKAYCALEDRDELPEGYTFTRFSMERWQRRMFLAPEPEIPEDVKDLLEIWIDPSCPEVATEKNRKIIEAYKRGRNSK